ncbi:MAG: hypothetical protein IJY49_03260 [Clostridia bacterium]|nr:hypothetical protein [Clostridia bacterium]
MNKKVISIVAIIALVAILGVCLVACNADSYAKKLEKAGYVVQTFTGDEANDEAEAEGVKWMVVGLKMNNLIDADSVMVVAFDNADDAKAFADAMNGEGENVELSGKIVIVGTEQGVKDAK